VGSVASVVEAMWVSLSCKGRRNRDFHRCRLRAVARNEPLHLEAVVEIDVSTSGQEYFRIFLELSQGGITVSTEESPNLSSDVVMVHSQWPISIPSVAHLGTTADPANAVLSLKHEIIIFESKPILSFKAEPSIVASTRVGSLRPLARFVTLPTMTTLAYAFQAILGAAV
jgi:hypothetical protein